MSRELPDGIDGQLYLGDQVPPPPPFRVRETEGDEPKKTTTVLYERVLATWRDPTTLETRFVCIDPRKLLGVPYCNAFKYERQYLYWSAVLRVTTDVDMNISK